MRKPNMDCGECPYWLAYGEPETTDEQNEAILAHCAECDACDGRCFDCDCFDSTKEECRKENKRRNDNAKKGCDSLVLSLIEAGGEIRELKKEKRRLIFALKEAVVWLNYFLTTKSDDICYDDINEVRRRAEYLLMDMEDTE